MLAVIYMLLASSLGMLWIASCVPANETTSSERPINRLWILLAAGAAAGTLFTTWCLYLTAWLLKVYAGVAQPLYIANGVVMGGGTGLLVWGLWRRRDFLSGHSPLRGLVTDRGLFARECFLYLGLLLFIIMTFSHVLFVKEGRLYAGYTVFSDYAPHLAMARSFSRSANYPTMYPHFGGEDVKYHFMFQFLTGNLEFLGLRLDLAYNLAGILFMWTFLVVLTQLALRLWGRLRAGVLTACFFFFRSGLTFFRFVCEHLSAGDLAEVLSENREFIGYTPNENWGLWNYNVYLNQRHLAFGLTLAGTLVWFYLDYLVRAENEIHTYDNGNEKTPAAGGSPEFGNRFRFLFLSHEAWIPACPLKAVRVGILLGLTAFWNGAAVIGCLLILLGFTVFSRHKIDYALTAGAAVFISFLQTRFFIRGSAVSAGFYWGFISEDKSLLGILVFLIYISGLTILGGLGLLFLLRGLRRTYLAAMFLPVVFTFTMSLTPDVTVNQKYIMIACAFLAPVWGGVVDQLFGKPGGRVRRRVVGLIMAILLTATGIYDFSIIIRDNGEDRSLVVALESDVADWLDATLRPDQLILTPLYSLSEVTLSGKMLYLGWPYYAWSAGYDTYYRGDMSRLIYTTDDEAVLRDTVAAENISYILFEEGMTIDEAPAREALIAELFRHCYTSPDGRIRIYETGVASS